MHRTTTTLHLGNYRRIEGRTSLEGYHAGTNNFITTADFYYRDYGFIHRRGDTDRLAAVGCSFVKPITIGDLFCHTTSAGTSVVAKTKCLNSKKFLPVYCTQIAYRQIIIESVDFELVLTGPIRKDRGLWALSFQPNTSGLGDYNEDDFVNYVPTFNCVRLMNNSVHGKGNFRLVWTPKAHIDGRSAYGYSFKAGLNLQTMLVGYLICAHEFSDRVDPLSSFKGEEIGIRIQINSVGHLYCRTLSSPVKTKFESLVPTIYDVKALKDQHLAVFYDSEYGFEIPAYISDSGEYELDKSSTEYNEYKSRIYQDEFEWI